MADILAGWQPLAGRSDYFDLAVNFFFYLPLGTLGVLAWGGCETEMVAVACAVCRRDRALANAWKWRKHGFPGRDSSIRDLIMNALGTLAGMVLAPRFCATGRVGGV